VVYPELLSELVDPFAHGVVTFVFNLFEVSCVDEPSRGAIGRHPAVSDDHGTMHVAVLEAEEHTSGHLVAPHGCDVPDR
jgi:hypothetical protein